MASAEEQETLAKYVGWGGLAGAFDEQDSGWSREYQELKGLLTDEEYRSARSSTLTAFYTPPVVTEAIYSTLERLGFSGGNVLEPAMGTGHFFGTMPEAYKRDKSRLYGVELDSVSGRIAKQLLSGNPRYRSADTKIRITRTISSTWPSGTCLLGSLRWRTLAITSSTTAYTTIILRRLWIRCALEASSPL